MRLSGIYAILNAIAPECYVGQSVDIYRRLAEHLMYFRENRNTQNIQNPWNRYGETNFKFLILETCEENYRLLTTLENYWINLIGTYNKKLPTDWSQHPHWQKTARLLFKRSSLMRLPEINKDELL
jgi:group I intron endonuclease